MIHQFPEMAHGFAQPLNEVVLLTDSGVVLLTDQGIEILMNTEVELRYTHPDLHRRIDEDATPLPGRDYLLAVYDKDGNPYPQHVRIGVFDYMHSVRLTETYVHDEESTTSEVP